jgi:hypothetical protein
VRAFFDQRFAQFRIGASDLLDKLVHRAEGVFDGDGPLSEAGIRSRSI